MWKSAASALSEATSMLIFGFSLPASDLLVVRMIHEALLRGRMRTISIVDIDPEPVAARLKKRLLSAAAVDIQTFTVPSDGSEPGCLARDS
jgi:hypothetical protein